MRSLRPAVTLSLIITTSCLGATTEIPEKWRLAVAEWNPSFTQEQRADLSRRYGPFDLAAVKKIEDYGEHLQNTGHNEESLHYFEFCFPYAQDVGDDVYSSICEQLMAGTERLMGRYLEAETHYRDALEWARHPGAERRVPIVLGNLAGVYVAQARYGEALQMLDQVDEIDRRNGVTNDVPPVQNRAIIYGLQGDLARSLEQFLKALQMYEKLGDQKKIALAHYNIGVLQIKQANYDGAAKELETALALAEKNGDRNRASQALSDLGRVRDLQGRPREALDFMTRAAAIAREIGYKSAYGETLVNLADFHQAHNEFLQARSIYEDALKIFEELHDGNDLGLTLRGLGLVALREGRNADAVRYATRAVETAHNIGDMQGDWQAEALAGMAARASGDAAGARANFVKAIDLIELQRGMVAGGEVEKQRFFEEAAYPYQQLAVLASSDGGFPALQAAERARARVLLDMLEGGPDHLERFFTADERSEENRFRASISGLNARISSSSPATLEALVKERDQVWHSYQTFLEGIYVRNPDLRNWRGAASPLSESDVAALVSEPAMAVIEYLCARDETLVFLITRGADPSRPHIQVARIPVGLEEMKKRTARLHMLIETRDPGYRAEAQSVYKLLLGPVAGRTLLTQKRIWMIPDGPLWDVPFQALIDNSGHYWIENASISFAPSLTFLREKSAPARPLSFTRDLVAFGDPARTDAPPVPGLRDQVRRISAFYDAPRSEVKMGADAGEESFRQSAPTARVVHVAAHGIMDEGNALHSRILLSGNGTEDGWIEAWELMRMGIKADLVVLSACESGRGQIAEGEGLVGLTWALFVSGARNTVVSQWRVESESASALMVGLHKRMRQGARPSDALRSSVLEVMKNERYRHPMYWAAFVSVGVDSPLGK
jgi:CHAT domain-containing protein/tetratricopeptide (TPR) repeat protein